MSGAVPNPLDQLPHGEPFRFLTRVISLAVGAEGVAEWDLTGDEDFFLGHFPGDPIVPGVLLTEAAAQLSGLVAYGQRDENDEAIQARDGLMKRVRLAQSSMKFPASARPPATIVVRARFERAVGVLSLLSVRAQCGANVVAEGKITLARAAEGA